MQATRLIALVAAALLMGCNPCAKNWFVSEGGSVVPATIVALDHAHREFTIRTEDRGIFSLPAGPQVRNLSHFAAGDCVEAWYDPLEVFAFLDPDDRSKGAISSSHHLQASYGDTKPALMVTTFLSYEHGTAMLRTPDGLTLSGRVDHELLSYTDRSRPGDRVGVAWDKSEAVKITKVSRQ